MGENKQTKWNINLRNKKESINSTEPFVVTSNYHEPLLQTLPFLQSLPFPISSSSTTTNPPIIETLSNRSSMSSNRSAIPTENEIAKMNTKVNNVCNSTTTPTEKPTPIPGKNNRVDSNGKYSIVMYNGNTYLNGFNCNEGGCDMSGVDVYINWENCKNGGCSLNDIEIKSDPTDVNTQNKVYFRDGKDNLIDAFKLNLKDVTFGNVSLVDYLTRPKPSIDILAGGTVNPLNTAGSVDTSIPNKKYFQADTSRPNYFNKNPFDTPPTERSNPFTTKTMNSPIESNEGLTGQEEKGINKIDTKKSGDVKKNFFTWWENTAVPIIIKYNAVALINQALYYIYNKFFIELFGGNFQLSAYITVLFNFYIVIGYMLCIFITYNVYYRFFLRFFKDQPNEKSEKDNSKSEKTSSTFLTGIISALKKTFFAVDFLYSLIDFINQIPIVLVESFERTSITNKTLGKAIFVGLFLLILYLVLYLQWPYYLGKAFINSLRYGKDENGEIDIFTHYTMISICLFGIAMTIYNYGYETIQDKSTRINDAWSFTYILITIFTIIFKLILSISITWMAVFVLCVNIIYYTVFPINLFKNIHDINKCFDKKYEPLSLDSNLTVEIKDGSNIALIVDYIYKYIIEIGLIAIFVIQSIKYGKTIDNQYSLFKAMLISVCWFFIFICGLFFFTSVKVGVSRYIDYALILCFSTFAFVLLWSSIDIIIKMVNDGL